MKLSKLATIFLFFTFVCASWAQAPYAADNFLFPINPGKQSFLAGTMGELRPGHFHGGIDVKTGGKTGLPVLATADGYISRIKISLGGYGHALYIQHPNGKTSVYAHLDKFYGAIQKHVVEQQYDKKSYTLELFPGHKDFLVKRGDTIAYSGNTGGSSGPHLHFEIRNKRQEPLDPLAFGFKEIRDNTAPVFYSIAARPLEINARVKNFFYPFIYETKKHQQNHYRTQDTIRAFGAIGLAINANDLLDEMPNRNGIPTINMYVNDSLYYTSFLDKFSFATQNRIKVLVDNEMYGEGRGKFRKCYIDAGNDLSFNTANTSKGVIHVKEGDTLAVKFTAEDLYGNKSSLSTTLVGIKPQQALSFMKTNAEEVEIEHTIFKNVLKIYVNNPAITEDLVLYQGYQQIRLEPDYSTERASFFLWDLRQGLPDSVRYKNHSHLFHFTAPILPGRFTQVYGDGFNVKFSKNALFDTLYLEMNRSQNTFVLGQATIPLKGNIKVVISTLPDSISETTNYSLYTKGNKSYFLCKISDDHEVSFRTSYFGSYEFLQDTVPPSITILNQNKNTISVKIEDELSGIQSYEAKLNGEWLLMQYDAKNNLLTSLQKNENAPLKGTFYLEVIDNQGNKHFIEKQL